MLILFLIAFPLFAGLSLLFIKGENAKKVALAASIIELGIAIAAFLQVRHNPDSPELFFDKEWIRSIGIHFNVALDGISMLMVLLTALLVPFIILSSFRREYENPSAFYSLILIMQMALVGVFSAMDGFLFYVFWELALIPIWFICLLWGGEDRARITFKFFVYTLVGSLFMLVGLIFVFLHTPNHSFSVNDLYAAGASLSGPQQGFVFWAFFLAFAIKMPVFPFHTWQPDTYTTAPTPGTMLLSGIMLKMGTYGLVRWLLPLVPLGVKDWANTAIILSVISIVYASCIAIVQKDFKRLIAYSSIAHVGLISAGIFSMTAQGIQGGLVQMVAHGINVVGLFFIADIILSRTNTRQITELGGIRNVEPGFAALFLIVLLGSVALPLTNGFIGEFLLINGLYQYDAWIAMFAGLTVILGAVYMLRSYQNVMLGETNSVTAGFAPLTASEKTVLIPLVILIIVMGVYPKPLMEIAEPAVQNILSIIKGVK
ncbi:MAG TPA: NADH-quinone oxidoreductase subunit M [Bacteroidia bacterium]|jgi:NADH-quinone oxidoreductase subunit M